jgi:Tfp pilus assembly protein PilZ
MQLRRRFKRIPIDIKIELDTKYGRTPHCIKVDIINLSAIGAYIYGCNNFKLNDEVRLKFSLPPSREQFVLNAKVVWLPDKQVQPHDYPGIGVEFYDLSAEIQGKLVAFIERNLSCKP